jgi:hypothetical protein
MSICTVGWPSEVKMARSVMPGTVASLVRDRDRVYGAAVTQRCRAANSPVAAPLLHERIEAMARAPERRHEVTRNI